MLRILAAVILFALLPAAHAEESSAMIAAQEILDQARIDAAGDCARAPDRLARILCLRQLRVGLRNYYPGFSVRNRSGGFAGYEVDIARRVADFLGVRLVPVVVDTKTRIPFVAGGEIDLAIASMSHNVQRDAEVRFIRPHYYESQSVVVGARDSAVRQWDDLAGRTVCVPSGALANVMFIRRHIRILTFDQPEQLLDALEFGECAFVMHDDTFFAEALVRPEWVARFTVKFGFAPLPWGMAVARQGTTRLAALLEALSIGFNADGVFLRLARDHGLNDTFLLNEQRRWVSPRCIAADGTASAACLNPPADTADAADVSAVTDQAAWLEGVAATRLGLRLDLSLLKRQSAVGLLISGVGYSLALVIGALVTTTASALLFAWLMTHGPTLVRRGVGGLTAIGQTSPLPLLLFFGYIVAGGVTQYNGHVALAAAVLVIGIYNGANAGRAIRDAYQAAPGQSFIGAVSVAGIQLVAFLINAVKGSPAAGMIGVPEFLNVTTDLTAYSRDRVAVYVTLLVFYTGLVLAVIVVLAQAEIRLGRFAQRSP